MSSFDGNDDLSATQAIMLGWRKLDGGWMRPIRDDEIVGYMYAGKPHRYVWTAVEAVKLDQEYARGKHRKYLL